MTHSLAQKCTRRPSGSWRIRRPANPTRTLPRGELGLPKEQALQESEFMICVIVCELVAAERDRSDNHPDAAWPSNRFDDQKVRPFEQGGADSGNRPLCEKHKL